MIGIFKNMLDVYILILILLILTFGYIILSTRKDSKKITDTYREELVNSILEYENSLYNYLKLCHDTDIKPDERYVHQEEEFIRFLRTELKHYDESKKN